MDHFTACELRRELISAEREQSANAKRYEPDSINALSYLQAELVLRRIMLRHGRTCRICQAESIGAVLLACSLSDRRVRA